MKNIRKGPMKKRNFIAKALRNPCFKQRIVKPLKGRGSYSRKARKN